MSLKLTKGVLFIFKHAQVCLLLRDVSLSQYHYQCMTRTSLISQTEIQWWVQLQINITRPVKWSFSHYFNENFVLSSGLFYNTKSINVTNFWW